MHTFQTIPQGYCCTPVVNLDESILFSGVFVYPKTKNTWSISSSGYLTVDNGAEEKVERHSRNCTAASLFPV